jgi:hypothetical protein
MNLLCFHFNLLKPSSSWSEKRYYSNILFSFFAYFFKLGKGKIAKPYTIRKKTNIFYSYLHSKLIYKATHTKSALLIPFKKPFFLIRCLGYCATGSMPSSRGRVPKTMIWLPFLILQFISHLLNWQNIGRFLKDSACTKSSR